MRNLATPNLRWSALSAAIFIHLTLGAGARELTIKVDEPGVTISPLLYGLMTEEINHSYDGGLYAELIRNRSFRDDPRSPVDWSLVTGKDSVGKIVLDDQQPIIGTALTCSLRVQVDSVAKGQRVGVANEGYWGIPIEPNTKYRVSFYAKGEDGFKGPLTVSLESADEKFVCAKADVPEVSADWKRYSLTLTTKALSPSKDNRFVISTKAAGIFWLNEVSLFPPTYKDRANGNRIDLMKKLAYLKPSFLRFPGGNYVEGDTIAERFDWKKTIGPIEQRPGHRDPWHYRSTDGLGLLEFLEWCEDLHMQPVLAVFAGYALKGQHIEPGPELQPFVQDALDEIEYVTGDASTHWGGERSKNGHPAPFALTYVEIGNEDNFDKSGSYDGRFAQFYDAIKSKYPHLKIIATARVKSRTPDVDDQHFYRSAADMEKMSGNYDKTDRNGPKIFVGEWASQDTKRPWEKPEEKPATPSMTAALGDAAWMTGLERNSDLVIMQSYAPLLVNINPGARQWRINLIGYDALHSFGSPSYYAQAMFARNRGDVVLPVELSARASPKPTDALTPSHDTRGADESLFATASKETASGDVIMKLVNTSAEAEPLQIHLKGVKSVKPIATGEVLTGAPDGRNSIAEPTKISPRPITFRKAAPNFHYELPPNSVTVLRLKAK